MVESAKLNNGAAIPLVGFGTASDGTLSHDQKKAAVHAALEVGYRHFDTASVYGSEASLGEALKEAIEAGSIKREDLFVTSKIWVTDTYPEGVLPALQKSLSALQLDYLDLYLIHWPLHYEAAPDDLQRPRKLLPFDLKGMWGAMESCMKQGLTRAIGVSNFSSKKIIDLLAIAVIPPAVNQVEMHPKWQQKHLRDVCGKANVHVTAWSPLGAPGAVWGSPAIISEPLIQDIASKHGKTPAQIVLRWGLDCGVSVIPKSYNKKRMVENFEVFEWRLTEEDHEKISKIEQKKNFDGSLFYTPEIGPAMSAQEFWDGEI